jgi:hypothetical protein
MESYKPKNTYYQTVLSSLYPVFFGITLSNYAYYESGKIVFPSLGLSGYITVSLLIVYYLSDWLKSVHRAGRKPEKYNAFILLALILSNLFYCGIILYVINDYKLCILIVGIYSFIVPWWDLLVWKPGKDSGKEKNITLLRLAASVFYLFLFLFYFGDDSRFEGTNNNWLLFLLNFLLLVIVAFKIFGTHVEIKKFDQADQS